MFSVKRGKTNKRYAFYLPKITKHVSHFSGLKLQYIRTLFYNKFTSQNQKTGRVIITCHLDFTLYLLDVVCQKYVQNNLNNDRFLSIKVVKQTWWNGRETMFTYYWEILFKIVDSLPLFGYIIIRNEFENRINKLAFEKKKKKTKT